MEELVQIISYHINQTDQTTTWKETCTEFQKYAKCSMSKHLQNLLRFSFCKNNLLTSF